ncbi:hypothetical protein ALC62_06475 [Cyphomyrmex costatus]|uniref:Uncharacterized protein n=1 Tax=Cyphomyrmex costatus TaxID=456900 RepID=A0A195CPW9_9HYME|nr:hypothetical protein ALC62_06475 [Cyphomyrmex costatus]
MKRNRKKEVKRERRVEERKRERQREREREACERRRKFHRTRRPWRVVRTEGTKTYDDKKKSMQPKPPEDISLERKRGVVEG